MREIVRDVVKPEKLEFTMPPVGAGSDYVAFIHHSGIARSMRASGAVRAAFTTPFTIPFIGTRSSRIGSLRTVNVLPGS